MLRFSGALFCTFLLLSALAPAGPKATDEVLSALQTRLENGTDFDDLIELLSKLEPAELAKLQAEYDKVWPRMRDAYLAAFKEAAKEQNSGPLRQANQKILRQMREHFHTVRGMAEGPMKSALKVKSRPALDQLREILLPSAERILRIAGDSLKAQRHQVLRLGTFRDGILRAAIAVELPETVKNIKGGEMRIAEEFSDLDHSGLRIMDKNRKVAGSAMIPETERLGVEELNLMRLLVGLNALVIDPKLCDAARGHSEDMAKKGFFSHTSPVPGKASPSDRARLAGTTGGGENIYIGSAQPKAANKGWFYSPGHHKNMFSPGYRRVGMGNYGRHWTQMFGR